MPPSSVDTLSILYVDDEEQSLKYFRKALEEPGVSVLTSNSAEDAMQLLDRKPGQIAVLITDQRMPGKSGVDLLAYVRQKDPSIIRMLTTAYADTESAIEAVNAGAIYRYVVKPWNVKELRTTLRQARDLYNLQRERDLLVREKLSVLQRIVIADRVQSLAVLAAGLAHHIRNSMTALTNFLELAPTKLREEVAQTALKNPEFWGDMWSLASQESRRILSIVQSVTETVSDAPAHVFPQQLAVRELISAAAGAEMPLELSGPGAATRIRVDVSMAQRLLKILLRRLACSKTGRPVQIQISDSSDVWGTPGVEIALKGEGSGWGEEQIAALFTPFGKVDGQPQDLGLDILAAFFICHHHGGDLSVLRTPQPPGFMLRLPADPGQARHPSLETNLMEKLFSRLSSEEP